MAPVHFFSGIGSPEVFVPLIVIFMKFSFLSYKPRIEPTKSEGNYNIANFDLTQINKYKNRKKTKVQDCELNGINEVKNYSLYEALRGT